jgi:hypothetical protein
VTPAGRRRFRHDDDLAPGRALGGLRGTVLELGPGRGPNLPHYAPPCWPAGPSGSTCRADRDSGAALRRAGFRLIESHEFTEPGPLGTAIPHIAGTAVPAAREGEI